MKFFVSGNELKGTSGKDKVLRNSDMKDYLEKARNMAVAAMRKEERIIHERKTYGEDKDAFVDQHAYKAKNKFKDEADEMNNFATLYSNFVKIIDSLFGLMDILDRMMEEGITPNPKLHKEISLSQESIAIKLEARTEKATHNLIEWNDLIYNMGFLNSLIGRYLYNASSKNCLHYIKYATGVRDNKRLPIPKDDNNKDWTSSNGKMRNLINLIQKIDLKDPKKKQGAIEKFNMNGIYYYRREEQNVFDLLINYYVKETGKLELDPSQILLCSPFTHPQQTKSINLYLY